MSSTLIITEVENLFSIASSSINKKETTCIYLALNKNWAETEEQLKKLNTITKNIIFIDLISDKDGYEKKTLFIKPKNLNQLYKTIKIISKKIKEKKEILIDSLATLLIYNNQNKVAEFVNKLNQLTKKENINVTAISQKTNEEDLLNKVYHFFDEVVKK